MAGKFSLFSKKKNDKQIELENKEVPNHIAIIMDGNGRWAKNRNLPRIAGHKEGMEVVKKITITASDLGVEVLTMYAFSTENWNRPKTEVEFLMNLPIKFMDSFLPDLIKNNIRLETIGNIDGLPENTRKVILYAKEKTKENTGLILNFALNYGGRNDITEAIRQISEEVKQGNISTEDITDELISSKLMTSKVKDPELLIRTSGELRISNFMMWQIAYSELIFTDVLWPDFTQEHFVKAIEEFQRRNRRFGGL